MAKTVRFSVHYWTQPGQNLVVTGNAVALGEWDIQRSLRLGHLGGGQWTLEVTAPANEQVGNWEYKYALVDDHHHTSFLEAGPNHHVPSTSGASNIEVRDTFQVRSNAGRSTVRRKEGKREEARERPWLLPLSSLFYVFCSPSILLSYSKFHLFCYLLYSFIISVVFYTDG